MEREGAGTVLTKAISDVDDCAEGMRKFTTEVFDTGVAVAAYAGMLLWYDWRLALLSMAFLPGSYALAERMKGPIQRTGAAFKEGLETRVGTGGVRLSGGQAQRLALARTLAHRRPLLILDDPFSALDRATETEIFAHLRRLAADSVVILISHRLYLFPELDQVIWLENGEAKVKSHEELVGNTPNYAAQFDAQREEDSHE